MINTQMNFCESPVSFSKPVMKIDETKLFPDLFYQGGAE